MSPHLFELIQMLDPIFRCYAHPKLPKTYALSLYCGDDTVLQCPVWKLRAIYITITMSESHFPKNQTDPLSAQK